MAGFTRVSLAELRGLRRYLAHATVLSSPASQARGRLPSTGRASYDAWREVGMDLVVALFAGIMGAAMAGIWARDIASGIGYDATDGFLSARETDTDDLMIWHWLAEFGTAGLLMFGAMLLVIGAALADPVMLLGLGALSYTSANSLGWSLARPERRPYAVPMIIGLVGAAISAILLVFF